MKEQVVDIIKTWLPSLVILVAGITWGVKLDDRSLENKADIAVINGQMNAYEGRIDNLREQVTELNVLVRGMHAKVDYLVKKMDDHLTEAGSWKQKIINNEADIRSLNRGNGQ